MKAEFNGQVIAESDETVVVEGNHYFPLTSIESEYFSTPTGHSTHCPWKGDAGYLDVTVDGQTAPNSAWFYDAPFEKAAQLKDHVAFYPAITVS